MIFWAWDPKPGNKYPAGSVGIQKAFQITELGCPPLASSTSPWFARIGRACK